MAGGFHFREGNLRFDFGPAWEAVIRYDDHEETLGIRKVQHRLAVDFIGVHRDAGVWFIEVKDFRGHRITSKNLHAEDPADWLEQQVAHKVHDSLAGVVAARRHGKDPVWANVLSRLRHPSSPLKVVLWLEEDGAAGAVAASVGRNSLRKKLRWLTPSCEVAGSAEPLVPGLTVSNLPGAGLVE